MPPNPIWKALAGPQAFLAEGDRLARRFPEWIGPLSGMADQSYKAYQSLATLTRPDDPFVLFLEDAPTPPSGWQVLRITPLIQMTLAGILPETHPPIGIEPLGAADAPEMLSLTALTQPGPFRSRTCELGAYFGIREAGRLVAMAGERLRLTDHTEISAVCTHPDFTGRGYAAALTSTVARHILREGKTPFLHVMTENTPAIRVYEKLGFKPSGTLQAVGLQTASKVI